MSVEGVAGRTRRTVRTVRRWESGESRIDARSLTLLMKIYGVPETDQPELRELSREGMESGWWVPYSEVIRPSYGRFIGMQQEASSSLEYSAMLLPGLLQDEEYMRAVMRAALPRLTADVIQKRVELKMKRQEQMLHRSYPVHYIIDEAVLHRVVGSRAIMAHQLERLLKLADDADTTIQVLPFATGAHASVLGGFAVLTFEDLDPVAVVELMTGDLYAEGEAAGRYTQLFDALRQGALPEPMALEMIDEVRGRFRAC